jgi:hypothetical protein
MNISFTKIAISQAIIMMTVAMVLTAYLNMAEGSPVSPAPETPAVGETVIRETSPLSGTTAEGTTVIPPIPPQVEVTPAGKVATGSTDPKKAQELVQPETTEPEMKAK